MQNQKINLSVIIPCFNEAASIKQTTDSLKAELSNQPLEAFEIIVVNDGSTDNSKEILELTHIKIAGFMGMATFTDNQEQLAEEFSLLKTFFDTQKQQTKIHNCQLEILSMGMSGDYELAIKNGSTMIRVGSSIFGHRNYN